MPRPGRKQALSARRKAHFFAPAAHPGLLGALDVFEHVLKLALQREGVPSPVTSFREAVPGFGREEMSAWRTNLDRGNALFHAQRMIAALESPTPTGGACEDIDRIWNEQSIRDAARKLAGLLRRYCADAVEKQSKQALASDLKASIGSRTTAGAHRNHQCIYTWETAKAIMDNIYVPPDETPDSPEFPPDSPRFPATPTLEVNFDGRAIFVKDESKNPTGTHKDRWAWEMLVKYKRWFERQTSDIHGCVTIPRYSMISSGSAAIALQSLMRTRLLPDIRVVMDLERTDSRVVSRLRALGAQVYLVNLDDHPMSEAEIRSITENEEGQDVTPRNADEPFDNRYYDWLAYEILNERPRHIFVPFGTGGLFANIIYVINAQHTGTHDPRLQTPIQDLVGINVYGATSEDPGTQMHMLFARFRPTRSGIDQAVGDFVRRGTLGDRSGISPITDKQAQRASLQVPAFGIRTDLSGAAGLTLYSTMATRIPVKEKVVIVNTGCVYLPPV